jgi:general secretion pathway protein N
MAGREMMRGTKAAMLASALFAGTAALAANPPNALDLPPGGVAPPPVDMLQSAPAPQNAPPRELSGNPLWAIPLSTLSATRERPLFTPSRRPLAPAVAGPPPADPVAPPAPAGPERPQLLLVGVVGSDSGGIAVFIDQATNDVVRLRTGDSRSGWKLESAKGREAQLQRNGETLTFALPAPNAVAPPTPPPAAPPSPSGTPSPASAKPPQPGSAAPLPPGWTRTPSGEIVNTE